MSVLYKDGSFSETLPFNEAMETFNAAVSAGTARALYVGTEMEIGHIKKKKKLEDMVLELSDRLDNLEEGPVVSKSIVIPTRDEVLKFCGGVTAGDKF